MSFGVTELVIILAIVVLLFGTSKLKTLGSDLGAGFKSFRSAVSDEQDAEQESSIDEPETATNRPDS